MSEQWCRESEFEAEGLQVLAVEDLPSNVAAIGPAVERVVAHLREAGQPGSCDDNVDLALREALTNAVVHGNQRDPEKQVRVVVASDRSNQVVLIVRDQGHGFDPSTLPCATNGDRLYATNGRGVFLMRALVKDVSFRHGGREVRLRIGS